jgi:hypothetical protein
MIDYTTLIKKLVPDEDGQDVLRLRVGVVSAIATDGTVDLTLNGVTVPDVPVLGGAYFAVASTVQVLSYRGSLLIIGAAGPAAARPVATSGSITEGTTASSVWVNSLTTTGIHGAAFIAPPSGTVLVEGRATVRNSTVAAYSILDFEVKTGAVVGSGSTSRAPDDATAGVHQSAVANNQSSVLTGDLVTGLTPGSAYNAALTYHTGSGGTSGYTRRHITVIPQ